MSDLIPSAVVARLKKVISKTDSDKYLKGFWPYASVHSVSSFKTINKTNNEDIHPGCKVDYAIYRAWNMYREVGYPSTTVSGGGKF